MLLIKFIFFRGLFLYIGGAFIGGIVSSSLHGWIWIVFALLGTCLGVQLRPLFGMSK